MAFFNISFFSETLGRCVMANVILPEGVRRNKPCKNLYLLHGLSDDYSSWQRRTSIERYAEKYKIAVIMPDGEKSFYTDMKYGDNYYQYITKELPQKMKEYFFLSDKRENNYIAGNSMGGYGALKAALRAKGKYAAAAGLSPAIDMEIVRFEDSMSRVFGKSFKVKKEDNLFLLAKKASEFNIKPRLYVEIGTGDFLYEENQRFRKTVSELDLDYTYKESQGDHTWQSWDEYIKHALEWMFGDNSK